MVCNSYAEIAELRETFLRFVSLFDSPVPFAEYLSHQTWRSRLPFGNMSSKYIGLTKC